MLERRARLSRMTSLLALQKTLSEARLARLLQAEQLLSAREEDLIALTLRGGTLGAAGSRALAITARDRQGATAARETGESDRMGAERRERAAGRALARIEAEIEEQALRRGLEEIRLKGAQASRKFPETKS